MSQIILPTKATAEQKGIVFDFISLLAVGETISTKVVACTVLSGVDANPSSLIMGAATSSGTRVTQLVGGGVAGVTYVLTCTITTSSNQMLSLSGYLTVTRSIM